MARTLTARRSSPLDVIYIPVMIFDPAIMKGGQIMADFDTGNGHTCIRREVVETMGIPIVGRSMPVHGVTGSSTGIVVNLTLGLETDDGHRCMVEGHEVVVLGSMSCQCLLGRDMLRIFDVELRTDKAAILKYG